MKNLIIFEGICCSGKSTSAKNLSESVDAVFGKAALSKTVIGRNFKSSYQFQFNYSDAFYVADLIAYTKDFIVPNLSGNKLVIQDRYSDSISTYSKSCCRILNESSYNVQEQINYLEKREILLTPEQYFYFFASKETIISRLKASPTLIHEFFLKNISMIDFVFEEFEKVLYNRKKQGVKIHRIDTDKFDIHETKELLLRKLIGSASKVLIQSEEIKIDE